MGLSDDIEAVLQAMGLSDQTRSDTSYPEPTGIRFGTNWNKVRYVPIGCRSSVTTNIDPVGLADVAIPSLADIAIASRTSRRSN